MNTRAVMMLSAAFMAILGVGITFLPQEVLARVGAPPEGAPILLMQLLGALYLGFAMLDWMNRDSLIGGIYGRPVAMANFFNFAVGALALSRGAVALHFALEVTAMAAAYSALGIWFGAVLFTHPAPATRG